MRVPMTFFFHSLHNPCLDAGHNPSPNLETIRFQSIAMHLRGCVLACLAAIAAGSCFEFHPKGIYADVHDGSPRMSQRHRCSTENSGRARRGPEDGGAGLMEAYDHTAWQQPDVDRTPIHARRALTSDACAHRTRFRGARAVLQVTADVNPSFCNATVQFNVPGKPNPPPVGTPCTRTHAPAETRHTCTRARTYSLRSTRAMPRASPCSFGTRPSHPAR